MSEEIRDIKESISFLAETQRILSENFLLQQQQFNEFQQVLSSSLQESERRFNASQIRLEAIILNQQSQMQLLATRQSEIDERHAKLAERQAESDQRFHITLQEIRYLSQRVNQIEESP